MPATTFQLERFEDADTIVRREPFPFVVASGTLLESVRADLARDFPTFREPGFLPYNKEECGPAVNALIAEATSPEVANRLGAKLGIDNLVQYPALVTICTVLNRRAGTIHTDSKSKVATALIYLNESWNGSSDGCLRLLAANDNIDSTITPEVQPTYGNFVIFKRTDNSFHGHLPYEGERRVIQIAWVINQEEIDRKTQRGRLSRFVKSIFGSVDKRIGANRGRNASHLK